MISDELGIEFKDVTIDMLGRARQVKVDKDNTTIVEGAGDPNEIKARIKRQSAHRSRKPPPITTRKNCRSVLQSSPAALP